MARKHGFFRPHVAGLSGIYSTTLREGGGFNPATLFAASEVGVFTDPSDLATLWQDSARTTPVTADSDPSGGVDDKSGNANNGLQSTPASRPLYKSAAGVQSLLGDGTADHLVFSPFAYAAGAATFVFAIKAAPALSKYVFSEGNTGGSLPFYAIKSSNSNAAKLQIYIANEAGTEILAVNSTADALDSAWHVCTVTDSSTLASFRIDGQASGSASYTRSGSVTLNTAAMFALKRSTVGNYLAGSIGPFIGIGRILTADEISNTEAWVAAKVGVSL